MVCFLVIYNYLNYLNYVFTCLTKFAKAKVFLGADYPKELFTKCLIVPLKAYLGYFCAVSQPSRAIRPTAIRSVIIFSCALM